MAVKSVAELIAAAPNPGNLDDAAEWFSDCKEYAVSSDNGYITWLSLCGLMFNNQAPRVTELTRAILSELTSINS